MGLRILIVSLVRLGHGSGSGQHQLGLLTQWQRQGASLRLIVPQPSGHDRPGEALAGLCRFSLTGTRIGLPAALDHIFQIPAIISECLRNRPDAIYTRVNLLTPLVVATGRMMGVRVVIEHNSWLSKERRVQGGAGWLASLEEMSQILSSRWAHASRCVTSGLAEHLAARCGVPRHKLHAIGNGTDCERFFRKDRDTALSLFGLKPDRLHAGYIGNIMPWHNLPVAIEGFARVAASVPELDLIVFGDGPGRNALEELAKSLNIAHRVRFFGAVASDRANDAINCLDVALLPLSLVNDAAFGFSSIKLRDYAAADRVVLTGRVPDHSTWPEMPWLLMHNADDPADFARALGQAARQWTDWRSPRPRGARAFAERHFDWSVIARDALALCKPDPQPPAA